MRGGIFSTFYNAGGKGVHQKGTNDFLKGNLHYMCSFFLICGCNFRSTRLSSNEETKVKILHMGNTESFDMLPNLIEKNYN